MSRRILVLSCILLAVSTGLQSYHRLSLRSDPQTINIQKLPTTTSEQLALGFKVKLSTLTYRELLAIPKTTELTALKLLSKRDAIIKAKHAGCSAFELVHGIGPAKALEICRWIMPE